MADKQVQTECIVETFLDVTNSSRLLNCGKCADPELQLLQALKELSSVQLIVDLLNKKLKHKHDEQSSDVVRNGYWSQVTSNYQKSQKMKAKIPPTTFQQQTVLNYYLTLLRIQMSIGQDTDKEPHNYSTYQQRSSFTRKPLLGVIIKQILRSQNTLARSMIVL